MKKKLFVIVIPAVLVGLFSFSVFQTDPGSVEKEVILKDIIFKAIMEQAHFNKLKIDDKLSSSSFDMYLKKLDAGKRFLTKADVEQLESFRFQIDDELRNEQPSELLKTAVSIWEKRREEARGYYKEILEQPFDFTKEESIQLEPDKREFPEDQDAVKDEWRKYLKYNALVRYHAKLEEQQKKADSDEDYQPKSEADLEKEVREEVRSNYDNLFDRLAQMDQEDYTADYINAILSVYGPHTEYFPPQEKENFDISMSGRLEGIGAQLSQVDGDIKVVRIVPGSASWKQGDLKEEDVVLKVGQAEEEPVSVIGMPLKDAVSMIRGKKDTEVRLTVKKPDGRIKVIPIVRDVVVLEESYAKSAVIEDKINNQKIGYIYLPSFYADFSGRGGRSSADDVRKELEKLKARNVSGVILDLRFNGGGSLQDAVDMSGLFFEKGPVVQVKGQRGNPVILEDKKNDVVWDGPLSIMINEFSASASEILAAAMQDYGRATIIGSRSSFGKGTVQRFVELDYYLPAQYNAYKPLGSVKLTIQKFYRITGKSTQWKGVESDIVLPDVYSYLDVGEKGLEFALPWDEITSEPFESWSADFNNKQLSVNSMKRIQENEIFQKIEQNAVRMKEQLDKTLQTLNLDSFMAEQKQLDEESEKFSDLTKDQDHLVIEPVDKLLPKNRLDSIKVESLEKWQKELQENVYLGEAMSVMNDLLQQKSVAVTEKK